MDIVTAATLIQATVSKMEPSTIWFAALAFGSIIGIHEKIVHNARTDELEEAKHRYFSDKMLFVENILDEVEKQSIKRAEEWIAKNGGGVVCPSCGAKTSSEQMREFRFMWFDNKSGLKARIKGYVRANGFSHRTTDELKTHISTNAIKLISESRDRVNSRILSYPLLAGSDDFRFTKAQATKLLQDITYRCMVINGEEARAKKAIRDKYSILKMVSTIRGMLKKLPDVPTSTSGNDTTPNA